eukprot:m.436916 g.436916  ORF g.436916 m.436916 type:complete len:92 (+) comp56778_c1_seq9:1236-1511(+)
MAYGSLQSLCEEAVSIEQAWRSLPQSQAQGAEGQRLSKIHRLITQGEVGKAAALLSSTNTLASDDDPEVLSQLETLLLSEPYSVSSTYWRD